MNRTIPAFLGTLLLAGMSYAQPAPPPEGGPGGAGGGPEGGGPPPPRQNDERPGDRQGDRPGDRRDGPGGRHDGPGGSGGAAARGPHDGPPRPGMQLGRPGPIEQMKNFLDLVDKYNALGKDADATAVAAVINTVDILRPRGPEAIIVKLEKMLAETKNAAVQRVIRLQLADFYRQTNQADKALEHLDVLIKGASASSN